MLRPIGSTILTEFLISPLVGLGAGLAGGVIGLATAPGKTTSQHQMGGALETQQNAAAGLGFIIGYSLGTGIGGYLIAKDGYPKSSIWFSTFASVLGESVGAAIFSAFDNEPYTLLIPVITPVVFTVLLNHIYGTF